MDDLTYPNGFRYIGQKLIVGKRKPFVTGTDLFPDPDIALEPLIERIVPQVDAPKIDSTNLTDFAIRRQRIQAGLAGQSELVFLCAQLVMILRRDPVTPDMLDLWRRMWSQTSDVLCLLLPARWKISCLQCFNDHGRTEAERRIGGEMVTFAAMLKLYETERQFSGMQPERAYAIKSRVETALPLGLEPYSVRLGDLDRHLLGRLWMLSEQAGGGCGALVQSLLDQLNTENGNLFRRFRLMRNRLNAADKDG